MPDVAAPLPAGAVLVHVGPYKTGTSAIQMGLHQRRADLAGHAVLYPGRDYRHRRESAAFLGRSPNGMRKVPREEWTALVDVVRDAPDHRAVVSSEAFSSADADQVGRLARDLGVDRVHALYVVRRLDRLMPSVWQERVKSSNETRTYREWLDPVLAQDDTEAAAARFWRVHGVAEFVDHWTRVLPPERVMLVVADESDRSQMPRLLERLLDLPEGMLTADDRPNTGLSWEKVEVFRRLNEAFAANDEWSAPLRRELMMRGLLSSLQKVPDDESTVRLPTLDPARAARVEELSRARADLVRDSGVRVDGDPETLAVQVAPADSEDLPEAPSAIGIDAVVAGLEGIIDVVASRERRIKRKAKQAKQAKQAQQGKQGKQGKKGGRP